jgi:hypothetical protein
MTLNDEKFTRFNWFNYSEFYDFITEKDFKVLVELGVWKGHSISYLAEKNKSSEIYAVDLWDMFPFEYEILKYPSGKWRGPKPRKKFLDDGKNLKKIYNDYLRLNGTRHIVNDIQMDATKASNLFNTEEIDFIFIDLWPGADHLDILNSWYSKVKKNGIISGHDYNKKEISKSVDKFIFTTGHKLNVEKEQKVWWITK